MITNSRANGMPSGCAVVLGGVCLEIQDCSRLTCVISGRKGEAGGLALN